MLAIIPTSISIILDPKKTLGQKALAFLILIPIVALSIAAFTVAALPAAIIGTSIAAFFTVMELIKLVIVSVEKHQARTDYNKMKAFNEALDTALETKNFEGIDRDLLDVRVLELQHRKDKPGLSHDEKISIPKKLDTIQEYLEQNKRLTEETKDKPVGKLKELYKNREHRLLQLADQVSLIKFAQKEKRDYKDNLDTVKELQDMILQIDEEIDTITQPIEKLKLRNLVADETIARTSTNLLMAIAGLTLSIIGLLVIAGGAAAAPAALAPITSIIGGTISVFLLAKWGAEKIAADNDALALEKRNEDQLDDILDEALYSYDAEILTRELDLERDFGESMRKKYHPSNSDSTILDILRAAPVSPAKEVVIPERSDVPLNAPSNHELNKEALRNLKEIPKKNNQGDGDKDDDEDGDNKHLHL